jgi:hypothetical protein
MTGVEIAQIVASHRPAVVPGLRAKPYDCGVNESFVSIGRRMGGPTPPDVDGLLAANDRTSLARFVWAAGHGLSLICDFPRAAAGPAAIAAMLRSLDQAAAAGVHPRGRGYHGGMADAPGPSRAGVLASVVSGLTESGWEIRVSGEEAQVAIPGEARLPRIRVWADRDVALRLPLPPLGGHAQEVAQAVGLYLLVRGQHHHFVAGLWDSATSAPAFGMRIPLELASAAVVDHALNALASVADGWEDQNLLRDVRCAQLYKEAYLGSVPLSPKTKTMKERQR